MNKGFSLVEFMIAAALFVIIATTLGALIMQGMTTNRNAMERTRATYLAQEAIEAIKSIRNQNYALLINGTHGLDTSNGYWALSGSSDTLDIYTRTIIIEDAQRNGSNTIVESGGTADPDTKKITATISWDYLPGDNISISESTYVSNYNSNISTPTPTLTPTPTTTPGPTSTPTLTPTPTSGISTCTGYCQNSGYTTGTCRQNSRRCSQNGETYKSGGNSYCTGGPSADTCCCAP